MTTSDKAAAKAQEVKGMAEEAVGRLAGDHELEAQGKVDKLAAGLKQANEKLKEAGEKVKEAGEKVKGAGEKVKEAGEKLLGHRD